MLLVLLIAGCHRGAHYPTGDPQNDPLRTGSIAMIQGEAGTFLDDGGIKPSLNPGDLVRVDEDPGHFKDSSDGDRRYDAPHPMAKNRSVHVTVIDGRLRGRSGEVIRIYLMPRE